MKLKFDVEILQMDDDTIAVPVGDEAENFHGVLKLNDSARFILEQLKEDTTEEQIVDAVLKEYEGDRAEITGFVRDYLAVLAENKLLA